MGTNANRYYGYYMDIQKEFSELYKKEREDDDYSVRDKYLFKEIPSPELDEFDFISYWDRKKKQGDVLILEDSISGTYTRLVYIEDCCESYNDNKIHDKIDKKVNKILEKELVEKQIENKLRKVYDVIFGSPKDETYPEVHLIDFIHYS